MYVVGIDLSGPSNKDDTAVVAFRMQKDRLQLVEAHCGVDDHFLFDLFQQWTVREEVVAGIDAPLSYNVGGGDRPGDTRLRTAIIAAGLLPGSVMVPTLTRMVYLTLRGMAVARLLQALAPRNPSIVEVHPGAAFALRGGPVQQILSFRKEKQARYNLLLWLERQGVEGVSTSDDPGSHYVAACSCALAAWKWSLNQSVWIEEAAPPFHPFDFAC